MGLKRLGILEPTENVVSKIVTVNTQYLASVIVTNKNSSKNAQISVFIKPSGVLISEPSKFVHVMYNFPLTVENTMETYRFAMNALDEVYVKSDVSGVSFMIEGIPQPEVGIRYTVGPTAQQPSTPTIGDQFYDTTFDTLSVYKSTGWKVVTTA